MTKIREPRIGDVYINHDNYYRHKIILIEIVEFTSRFSMYLKINVFDKNDVRNNEIYYNPYCSIETFVDNINIGILKLKYWRV